jgi:hypothetical protein
MVKWQIGKFCRYRHVMIMRFAVNQRQLAPGPAAG